MKKLLLIILAFCAMTTRAHEGCGNPAHKQQEEATLPIEPKVPEKDSSDTFITPETMPQYPGGSAKLIKFITKNLKYPAEALESAIQGRVSVRFIVQKDGSISNIEVLKSPHESLSKEAIRIIQSMPNWTPGSINGEPTNVFFVVPITFKLDEKPKKSKNK